ALVSKAFGFNFDASPVANEMSQLNAVLAKWEDPISFGVVDIEPALQQFNDELYAAGLQKVMDDNQRQEDEWLAKQKSWQLKFGTGCPARGCWVGRTVAPTSSFICHRSGPKRILHMLTKLKSLRPYNPL